MSTLFSSPQDEGLSQSPEACNLAGTVRASPTELPLEYKPIFSRLEKALGPSAWSDLEITCGDFGWDVHRVIVCPASEFFNSCCKNFKEAQNGVIDLPDDNKHAVDAMLRYLYTANYDDEAAIADAAPILFNVHVHTIADKYNIPELCKLAEAKFAERAGTEWNTEGFAEAVKEMYATSPDTKKNLQDSAVARAIEHADKLFGDGQTAFQQIAQNVALFAYGISSRLMADHLKARQEVGQEVHECVSCGREYKREYFTRLLHSHDNIVIPCPGCGYDIAWKGWRTI